MSNTDKVLTYEEAKQLCMKAFDGGALYGSESMRYKVNATAYDWEHWLQKNESLFKPKPTVEDVLLEFVKKLNSIPIGNRDKEGKLFSEYAAKLRLAGEGE